MIRSMQNDDTGSSMIEILVVITMIAILTAVGVSTFRSSPYAFDGAVTELVSDLRMTRTLAQSRGAHYRLVVLNDSTYVIERLVPRDGIWEPARTDRRSKTLDFAVRLGSPEGTTVEFDTRGTAVGDAVVRTFDLEERKTGAVRGANVWPSGQVIKR
ncbi:MAG: pilus assembly FimT family protein [Candidatus Binatia bacterium]